MKELSLEQMKRIEGDKNLSASCWWSVGGFVALSIGAAFLTGRASLVAWGIGAVATTGNTITSC